ncbi:hypothetical protein B0H13DRAFT_2360498 [Mycena leptocephala]|nr:hypothetical protein B0H13DRAFT_2360498 [Mycena leptocephala]
MLDVAVPVDAAAAIAMTNASMPTASGPLTSSLLASGSTPLSLSAPACAPYPPLPLIALSARWPTFTLTPSTATLPIFLPALLTFCALYLLLSRPFPACASAPPGLPPKPLHALPRTRSNTLFALTFIATRLVFHLVLFGSLFWGVLILFSPSLFMFYAILSLYFRYSVPPLSRVASRTSFIPASLRFFSAMQKAAGVSAFSQPAERLACACRVPFCLRNLTVIGSRVGNTGELRGARGFTDVANPRATSPGHNARVGCAFGLGDAEGWRAACRRSIPSATRGDREQGMEVERGGEHEDEDGVGVLNAVDPTLLLKHVTR